ncbi:hypothetical protein DY000_02023887 [Brassica cretica]|uniref:Catalase immune-responsive domain-containing protein n=1 Tax=Brassica cretica TaxID=69181 RepID=A0ABQ7E2Y7_BRACR|nr:hypothetical protein DY000_02023887 [Brassica cretica]
MILSSIHHPSLKIPQEDYAVAAVVVVSCLQERFVKRFVEALAEPRVTHEIRSIWISYWTQADKSLGQKLASRLNVRPKY